MCKYYFFQSPSYNFYTYNFPLSMKKNIDKNTIRHKKNVYTDLIFLSLCWDSNKITHGSTYSTERLILQISRALGGYNPTTLGRSITCAPPPHSGSAKGRREHICHNWVFIFYDLYLLDDTVSIDIPLIRKNITIFIFISVSIDQCLLFLLCQT